MRHFILIILLFLCAIMSSPAQKFEKADTVINMTEYISYYSYSIQAPAFVIYKLYKGGGDVSRRGISFKEMKDVNGKKIPHFNYTNSGYDRGHLANAEDFAYSEESLRSTFYYINAIPQWPSVNRGTWQSNEKYLREESQNDSIIIVCGGCDWKNGIPKKCFKIAYSLSSGLCYQSYVFYNDSSCWISLNNKVTRQFPYKTVKQAYAESIEGCSQQTSYDGKKFKKYMK